MKGGRPGTDTTGENTWVPKGFEGHHKKFVCLILCKKNKQKTKQNKKHPGAGKVAQWAKAFVTKPKNQNLISATHMAESENWL